MDLTVAWLVRLRWGAVVAQATTVFVAAFALGVELRVGPLAAIILVTAASNLALAAWARARRPVGNAAIGAALVFDTLALTALLALSGGPSNPFSALYLVEVTIAALALGVRWAAAVVAVATIGYALLFFVSAQGDAMEHHHHGGSAFSTHLQAMWVAFAVTAGIIAYFVARVSGALREREAELAEAQRLAARTEKLASLTTLAAGAAHELGTPLATIAIASKELERALARTETPALAADARLIREEVERCSRIVQQMSGRAGEAMGEARVVTPIAEVVEAIRARVPADRLDVALDAAPARATLPARGLAQALGSLVKNAFDASAGDARVSLRVEGAGDTLRFVVSDNGRGIAAPDLARVGEPFFTTKAPGQGMGLGVFLASAFAERWGGKVTLESEIERGTRATLVIPLDREAT